jgi:hypothetical protein
MDARQRLPNRRMSAIAEFENANLRYLATATLSPDGKPLELFLDGPKIGSAAHIAARDAAIITSLALQNGVEVETILHSLEKSRAGEPVGPIGVALALFVPSSAGLSAVDAGSPRESSSWPAPSVPA